MGFNLLITNRAVDVFFFHLSLLLSLFFLWPSSDHIWSCRQIAHISAREISMSEYLIFPTLFLCISPSLHLAVSNTSCRARSWLIRALVANASSPSPAAEMNGDQMRSSYEVGCWVIGDTSSREEERERWKWGGGRWNEMNIYSGMYPLLEVLWFPGGLTKHLNS